MRAYVFLGAGGRAFLTGVRWPPPADGAPGAWVESAPGADVRGHELRDLPWWLDDELWELELGGEVQPGRRVLIAERGRLVARIAGWGDGTAWELVDACARRVGEHAAEALRAEGRADEAAALVGAVDLELLERRAAELARGEGLGARLAGFCADTIAYAHAADGARAASVAAYIAAHAVAGGDRELPGYERRFELERDWQAEWLRARLSL